MTPVEEDVNKIDELIKKMNKCNNNVKLILELLKTIDEKSKEESKENIKPPEKRSIGRPPTGSYDEKRKQYLEMLNSKKIKSPKPQTMEFYKTDYDEDTETYS